MSEMVESALRLLLISRDKQEKLVALPTFHGGGTLVDIADRARPWEAISAVDTNVLVYAANADSQFHAPCRDWLER